MVDLLDNRFKVIKAYRDGKTIQSWSLHKHPEVWANVTSESQLLNTICDENIVFRVLPRLPQSKDYYSLTPDVLKAVNEGKRIQYYNTRVSEWITLDLVEIVNRQYRVHHDSNL